MRFPECLALTRFAECILAGISEGPRKTPRSLNDQEDFSEEASFRGNIFGYSFGYRHQFDLFTSD